MGKTTIVFVHTPGRSKLFDGDAIRDDYNLLLIDDKGMANWLKFNVYSAFALGHAIDADEIALAQAQAEGSHVNQCHRELNKHQNIKAKLSAGQQCVIDSTDAKRFGHHNLYLRCGRLNKKALLQGLKFFLLQRGYCASFDTVEFFLVKPL